MIRQVYFTIIAGAGKRPTHVSNPRRSKHIYCACTTRTLAILTSVFLSVKPYNNKRCFQMMVTIPLGDELRRMYLSDTCCSPSANSRSPITKLECQCGSSDTDPIQELVIRWIYYHVLKQAIMMFRCNYLHEDIRT